MEFKSLENCDYVMFPRLQEQGIEFKHVERDAFKAELRHVEGHGDFWLLHQQAKPHVVVHIQLAKDENDFDRILGWFIGHKVYALADSARWWHEYGSEATRVR